MDYSKQTGTKIAILCDEMCPGDCSSNWQYNDSGWKEDGGIEIACANSKGIIPQSMDYNILRTKLFKLSLIIIICFLYLKNNFYFSNNLRVVEAFFVVLQAGIYMISIGPQTTNTFEVIWS